MIGGAQAAPWVDPRSVFALLDDCDASAAQPSSRLYSGFVREHVCTKGAKGTDSRRQRRTGRPLGCGGEHNRTALDSYWQLLACASTHRILWVDPGFDAPAWWAVIGPANIPAPIVTRFNEAIIRILNNPDVAQRLRAQGIDILAHGPQETTAFVQRQINTWGPFIRANNITQ